MTSLKAVIEVKVNTKEVNPALISLFEDGSQLIFLDANCLIVPDRSNSVRDARPISFEKYREYWLAPLFDAFPNLAIHETVYEELIMPSLRCFIDDKISTVPAKLRVRRDSELNSIEQNLLEMQIQKLAPYSEYVPELDNSNDRGEIRSLAYMAVKNCLYFAANDHLPIELINNASELETGLDEMSVLQTYEIIYYLYKTGKYTNKGLKMLYKYQYYLNSVDKGTNPDWTSFIQKMDALYASVSSDVSK